MAAKASKRRDIDESERVTVGRLRQIGSMDPYADADPRAVEARLRNMNYGATNSRLSKLRADGAVVESAEPALTGGLADS